MKAAPDINDTLRREGDAAARARHDNAREYKRKADGKSHLAPPEPDPHGQGIDGAEIDLDRLIDVEPRPYDWLWRGRIARRKLTLITGDPDLGKSHIGLDVAARISTGRVWPDEVSGRAPLGSCILLSAEDAADDTLRPRLEAADADLSRVYVVRRVRARDETGNLHPTVFSLQCDLEILGAKIAAIGDVSLIEFDPLNGYFGDEMDTHQTAAVRSVLAQLNDFALKYDVAILGIMHPPKTIAGGKAINAVTGSLAFIAAARMAFLVTADIAEPDRRIMTTIKNNLGAKSDGLAFRFKTRTVSQEIVATYLCWDSKPVLMSANEALAATAEAAKKDRGSMAEAKRFLRDLLADGPVPAAEAKEKAEAANISETTLKRAKKLLSIITEKDSDDFHGPWMWRLP